MLMTGGKLNGIRFIPEADKITGLFGTIDLIPVLVIIDHIFLSQVQNGGPFRKSGG